VNGTTKFKYWPSKIKTNKIICRSQLEDPPTFTCIFRFCHSSRVDLYLLCYLLHLTIYLSRVITLYQLILYLLDNRLPEKNLVVTKLWYGIWRLSIKPLHTLKPQVVVLVPNMYDLYLYTDIQNNPLWVVAEKPDNSKNSLLWDYAFPNIIKESDIQKIIHYKIRQWRYFNIIFGNKFLWENLTVTVS
jgi:hypothetical protein